MGELLLRFLLDVIVYTLVHILALPGYYTARLIVPLFSRGRLMVAPAFDREIAEMIIEPRPPHRADDIAGLQHRPQARPGPAAHEPEVAAVLARHQLEDGIRLPVLAHAENDSFIIPLHRICIA